MADLGPIIQIIFQFGFLGLLVWRFMVQDERQLRQDVRTALIQDWILAHITSINLANGHVSSVKTQHIDSKLEQSQRSNLAS